MPSSRTWTNSRAHWVGTRLLDVGVDVDVDVDVDVAIQFSARESKIVVVKEASLSASVEKRGEIVQARELESFRRLRFQVQQQVKQKSVRLEHGSL
jgi:hypothetical protein